MIDRVGMIVFGILFILGFGAIWYITRKFSIPDCSQQDGTDDHVSAYKYDTDSKKCVPDTCEAGYVFTPDNTCVQDCSKIDGSDVYVKSYIFDKKLGCIPATCIDESEPKGGVCTKPPDPTPPSYVNTGIVPRVMQDQNFTARFIDSGNLVTFYKDDKQVHAMYAGTYPTDTVVTLTSDGTLDINSATAGWLGNIGDRGNETDEYQLRIYDLNGEPGLVVYPIINGAVSSNKAWAQA
jgi:hypothetical protein